ncbi:MAG: hypothetical protein ACRDL6_03000 [Solirubrobacterales bacterium]
MIAHVAGFPLEETLTSLSGAGAALLMARVWLSQQLKRHRS